MQASSVIETIRKLVEQACRSNTNVFGYGIWTHHIVYVVHYGKQLASELNADAEIVELAALLHDYAGIKDYQLAADHHRHGMTEAELLLRPLEYPEAKIAAVKHCIFTHRGSVNLERTTPEAVCLASADAIAHIDQVPSLLYLAYTRRNHNVDDGNVWVRQKLIRSWNKLCPEARRIIQPKYEAAQLMLKPSNL